MEAIVEKMLRKCSDWLMREGDNESDINIKRLFTPAAVVCIWMTIFDSARALLSGQEYYGVLMAIGAVSWILYFTAARFGASMGLVLDLLMLQSVLVVVAIDLLHSATMQPQRWSLVVIILDIGLVFDRDRVPKFVIPITIFYLFATSIEAHFRLGLYELPGEEPEICNCADPPCKTNIEKSFGSFTWAAGVLMFDYYFTRKFAHDLRYQLQRVKASVEVAAQVTAALARYDVDSAEKVITSGDNLPEELVESFIQLLANLRSYKAYLPHSCLVQDKAPDAQEEERRSSLSEEASENPSSLLTLATPQQVGAPMTDTSSWSSRGRRSRKRSMFSFESRSKASSVSECAGTDLKTVPRRARVSLAAGNMIGYLTSAGNLAGQPNADFIAADVERWCSAVVGAKGVMDLISGDRRYASFNARQTCAGHSSAAIGVLFVRAGDDLSECSWSGCVVTGQAVSGDFGSTSVLRFMVLGGVSSSLHPLERIAAGWQTKVLADSEAFSSACYDWDAQLLGAVFITKRGERPLRLYGMASRRESGEEMEEWMYQLEKIPDGMYAEANKAKETLIQVKLKGGTKEVVHDEDEEAVWRVSEVGLQVI
eukprot:Hpha_TRINITY_DN16130_c0_g7::TRINITY_DN16130_c0_g7_i1::g.5750::m.5750